MPLVVGSAALVRSAAVAGAPYGATDTEPAAREVAEFATTRLPCFWLQLWFYGHIDTVTVTEGS